MFFKIKSENMNNIENIIKYTTKLKLLYVEDNELARESTLSILEEFFGKIILAEDGEDGFEKYQQSTPDIIITDINMPKLNGLDMIAKIRAIDKNIPILILSAYNEASYFIESIKLGVEGYILKPMDINLFINSLQKITHNLQLEEDIKNHIHFLKQYQEATNHSSIVSKTDLKGIITYVNDDFCKISEYTQEELIGKNHNIIRHPDNKSIIFKEMWDTIKDKKEVWKGIIRNISKSGKSYYVKTTIKPILNQNGVITEYIALRDDITDIMNPKRQLQDLINSTKDAMALMIKIDSFEDIEKFYGQKIVQKVEDTFSNILMQNMPQEYGFERVFSLGNGEYVFAKSKNDCRLDMKEITLKLQDFQENINQIKIDIGDVEYDVSIIISFAYGENVLENIKYGITKLLDNKQDFILANNLSKNEQDRAKQNIQTLKKVKIALNEYKIVSHFQPIINNKSKEIEKYESLVRLVDENEEILSPYFFLDIAKKGKYYSQITAMVLDNSFEALKNTTMDISINLSALDIEKESTRKKLFELLEEHKEYSSRVVFELLEDESVKDFNTIKEFIYDVKKVGVKIAIDDFGAGYSNFERLLDYQPDILKIDGCLIKNIETDSYSLSVVKTIVSFAKEQNILTIAEFVENEAIFNILNDLDIDYSQGYYFGKPSPMIGS